MAIETLLCEHGQHKWKRESARGRKPRFCPKHLPTVEAKTETVTLHCEAGHDWERPRTKGKVPKWCPDHKPQAAVRAPKTEVLICAHDGHEWTRIKRGRSPKFCPEHQPEKVSTRIRVGEFTIPKIDSDNEIVLTIINDPGNSELKRKFNYVINEFQNPRPNREIEDWKRLRYTFNRLLQDAARYLHKTVNVKIDNDVIEGV